MIAPYFVLAGVVLTFITALLAFFTARQGKAKVTEVAGTVQEVHVLVNSQLQAVVARVTQLITAMEKAGVAVPPNMNGEGNEQA
jgi:hypothetical protein